MQPRLSVSSLLTSDQHFCCLQKSHGLWLYLKTMLDWPWTEKKPLLIFSPDPARGPLLGCIDLGIAGSANLQTSTDQTIDKRKQLIRLWKHMSQANILPFGSPFSLLFPQQRSAASHIHHVHMHTLVYNHEFRRTEHGHVPSKSMQQTKVFNVEGDSYWCIEPSTIGIYGDICMIKIDLDTVHFSWRNRKLMYMRQWIDVFVKR